MCLQATKKLTLKLIKRLKRNKKKRIKAWKVVSRGGAWHGADTSNSQLYSYHHPNVKRPWSDGVITSSCRRTNLPVLENEQIGPGFHVYLKKPNYWPAGMNAILEVWCNLEDLVAAGHPTSSSPPQAVFTKVTVTKNALERAKKEAGCDNT